jgi:peptide/nickel transport system substrate-binding protein
MTRLAQAVALVAVGLAGCRTPRPDGGAAARPLVIAAVREPEAMLPPLVSETVGRDIGDQVWERLADLRSAAGPSDTSAYQPRLASAWERLDSLTWRFHLRPGARWQDGTPLTAADVKFSFDAYTDSLIDNQARAVLERLHVVVEDSATFRIRFRDPSPEQLYDATYQVRIIPAHIWASRPVGAWAADTLVSHLVGSGPYRIATWKRGEYLTLEADSGAGRWPNISRVIWRFTSDPEAAINLALAGEADVLEQVGSPSQQARFARDSAFELKPYPSAVYGFLAFRIADARGRPHPIFGRREVRRALALGVNRRTVARSLLGPATLTPGGPMSGILWIAHQPIHVLPFDTAAARRSLDQDGWLLTGGTRARAGVPLRFDILVPGTSSIRKQAAEILQEAWRQLGADVTVTTVDFPVFEERIRAGKFDTYIGAYLDEPSPRGVADQFGRSGWGQLNYGRYANPHFDQLWASASREPDLSVATRRYEEALDTLNADAPAVFLYSPTNVAAIRRTVLDVQLNPYSWAAGLRGWRLTGAPGPEVGLR